MKRRYKFIIAVLTVGYWVGCSPVSFEKDNSIQCQGYSGCIYTPEGRQFDETKIINGGAVDILFVDDNSGSMSFEQSEVANRFTNFIQSLDARSLDYRIGIITTDVSASLNNGPRPINGNGALQDGKLIAFSSGVYYISKDTPSKEQLFANTIRRAETLNCETFLNTNPNVGQTSPTYLSNCPSADERGIYAANLFIQNSGSFVRPNSHLAIVFLSDEDVRSSLYHQVTNYTLDAMDLPQTLINRIQSTFGSKGFSIHSLIVRPGTASGGAQQVAEMIAGGTAPTALFSGGDVNCLNIQGSQTNNVTGSYGYLYALATRMTNGIEGNICSGNYTAELQNIATNIGERVNQYNLACSSPTNLIITLNGNSFAQFTRSGSVISFSQDLPTGATLRVRYSCPAL